MKTIEIPKALAEELLKYLWSRPMCETYELFNQLSVAIKEGLGQGEQPNLGQPTGALLHRDQLAKQ